MRLRAGHGIHAPGSIPAAFADAELAIALDTRIFERIAVDIAHWNRLGLPIGRIAFNVSAATFRQEDFASRLLARAEHAGVPLSCLELEVTETVLLERASHNIAATFERLRDAGITIALDDFGTGYASLIHLKQFPVDVLKIDCSFIQSLEDLSNAAIVLTIVNLGSDLGITMVAEDIGTDAQADRLHRKGYHQAQGHLFSAAVAADAAVNKLLAGTNMHWTRKERRVAKDRRSA